MREHCTRLYRNPLIPIVLMCTMLATGCSRQNRNQVEIKCRPGQTQGADGSCQTSTNTSTEQNLPPGNSWQDQSEKVQPNAYEPGKVDPLADANNKPQNTEPEKNDNKVTPPPANPEPKKPDPAKPDPVKPEPSKPEPGKVDPNKSNGEAVMTLFDSAPKSSAEGAPLLAIKYALHPTKGPLAAVGFSHTYDLSDVSYVYLAKPLNAKADELESSKTLSLEIANLPITVNFKWNGKTCTSGVVEATTVAKTATVTCQ